MAQCWAAFADVLHSCGVTGTAAAEEQDENHAVRTVDAIHHRVACGVVGTGETEGLAVAWRTAGTGPRWVGPTAAAVAVVAEPGP